jgi:hypothetical protein
MGDFLRPSRRFSDFMYWQKMNLWENKITFLQNIFLWGNKMIFLQNIFLWENKMLSLSKNLITGK